MLAPSDRKRSCSTAPIAANPSHPVNLFPTASPKGQPPEIGRCTQHPCKRSGQSGSPVGPRAGSASGYLPSLDRSSRGVPHCWSGTRQATPSGAAAAAPSRRRCSTQAPPTDRPAPPLAKIPSAASTMSSVGAVDQTAGPGAKQPPSPDDRLRRQAAARATHHAAAQQPAGRNRTTPPLPMQIGHCALRCASPAIGDERS